MGDAKKPIKSVHLFDEDGRSVLEKRKLRRENAILLERVEQLERLLAGLIMRDKIIGFDDLVRPTRH